MTLMPRIGSEAASMSNDTNPYAVICPNMRIARAEADALYREVGGTLTLSGLRLRHPDGKWTVFLTAVQASRRLRGMRLSGFRFVAPDLMTSADYHSAREQAELCVVPRVGK